jgi:hypothetical protein
VAWATSCRSSNAGPGVADLGFPSRVGYRTERPQRTRPVKSTGGPERRAAGKRWGARSASRCLLVTGREERAEVRRTIVTKSGDLQDWPTKPCRFDLAPEHQGPYRRPCPMKGHVIHEGWRGNRCGNLASNP